MLGLHPDHVRAECARGRLHGLHDGLGVEQHGEDDGRSLDGLRRRPGDVRTGVGQGVGLLLGAGSSTRTGNPAPARLRAIGAPIDPGSQNGDSGLVGHGGVPSYGREGPGTGPRPTYAAGGPRRETFVGWPGERDCAGPAAGQQGWPRGSSRTSSGGRWTSGWPGSSTPGTSRRSRPAGWEPREVAAGRGLPGRGVRRGRA